MSDRASNIRLARKNDSQSPAFRAADGDDSLSRQQRALRTVYQRRNPEEHALRSAAVNEIARQANQSHEVNGNWAGMWSNPSSSPAGNSHGLGAQLRQLSPPHDSMDGPLRFSSAFECGNLASAKLVVNGTRSRAASTGSCPSVSSTAAANLPTEREYEYELQVDEDTQSPTSHTQWFYFCVRSQREFRGTVRFRIVNLQKPRSLYEQGLQPHVCSVRKNCGWQPFACESVAYVTNSGRQRSRTGGGDGQREDRSSLSFSYRMELPDDEVYFASYPPYSYSMLCGFLAKLENHSQARAHLKRTELCRSIGQLPVPLLVVSENIRGMELAEDGSCEALHRRPAVAVIARQHPGEVVGSLVVQGLLRFLLGPTPHARLLREAYVFHVVPMVNVDGVVHGNSRCTLAGVDPNRVWHDPNPIIHPVIFALKNHLKCVTEGRATVIGTGGKGLDLFLDLHGHSTKFGCFFYGCCRTAPINNALFPKLCAMATRDVSFEQCHWQCPRSHRTTARYVLYKQLGVQSSYTLECSLFAPLAARACIRDNVRNGGSNRDVVGACFTPSRTEWVGCAIGRAAATFLQAGPVAAMDMTRGPLSHMEDSGRVEEEDSNVGSDTDEEFLPDLSCSKLLAHKRWLTLNLLQSTTNADVLENLVNAYGDRVPDFVRALRKDCEDDVGDSDGDDGVELETEADTEHGGPASGQQQQQLQPQPQQPRHVQLNSHITVQRQPQSQLPQGSLVSGSRPPRQPVVVRTALATNLNASNAHRSRLALSRQASAASDEDDHSSAFQAAQQFRDINTNSCSLRVGRACSSERRPSKADRKQLKCQSTHIWFEEELDTNPPRSCSVEPTFAGSGRRGRCVSNCKPPETVIQAPCERQSPMPLLVPPADCNSAWRSQAKRCCRSPRRTSRAGISASAHRGSQQHRLNCIATTTPREFAVIRTQAETTTRDTPDGQCMMAGFVKRSARTSSKPASETRDQSYQQQRLVNLSEVWRPRGLAR